MSNKLVQDLVCTIERKSAFSKGCIYFEQNLSCTDVCPCQANDIRQNVNTRLVAVKNIDDDEGDDEYIFNFSVYTL